MDGLRKQDFAREESFSGMATISEGGVGIQCGDWVVVGSFAVDIMVIRSRCVFKSLGLEEERS